MHNFNISRLNTDLGIFRISGLSNNEKIDSEKIDISTIEVMGTDGWVLLNQSSDKVIKLTKELMPIIQAHLKAKNS